MDRAIDLKYTSITLEQEEPFIHMVRGEAFLFVENAWKERLPVSFKKGGRMRQAHVVDVKSGKFPGALATFTFFGPLQSAV